MATEDDNDDNHDGGDSGDDDGDAGDDGDDGDDGALECNWRAWRTLSSSPAAAKQLHWRKRKKPQQDTAIRNPQAGPAIRSPRNP